MAGGTWRLAQSLNTLLAQVNAAYPNRSKASDGTIGDASHQAVSSDHNPNAEGVVCALDLTHDPAGGFDAHAIADQLLANRHPNMKYIISNRRIAGAWTGWAWNSYSGTNDPHVGHIHISVGVGEDGRSRQPYDDSTNWQFNAGVKKMSPELASEISKYGRLLGFNSEQKMYNSQAEDVKQIMANPMYAAGLLRQLYNGEWQNPAWKANNYDRLVVEMQKARELAEELSQRPTKENLQALQAQIIACTENQNKLVEEKEESVRTGNAILRFIADWWNARKK